MAFSVTDEIHVTRFKPLPSQWKCGRRWEGGIPRPRTFLPSLSPSRGTLVLQTQFHIQLKNFNDPETWIAAFVRVLVAKAARWRFSVSKVDKDFLLLETSLPLTSRELADAFKEMR